MLQSIVSAAFAAFDNMNKLAWTLLASLYWYGGAENLR